jgi:uncharacterized protein (DUF2147 family)
MKAIYLLIFIVFSIFNFQTKEKQIVGYWNSKEGNSKKIEIYLDKDGYFQGISAPSNKDKKSKKILKDLKYDSKTNSYKGTMSPPDKDILLDVTLTITSNNELKIVARKFIMSKTIYFVSAN